MAGALFNIQDQLDTVQHPPGLNGHAVAHPEHYLTMLE